MCRCNCPRSIRTNVIDYREPAAPSCWICGGNPDAITTAFQAGVQAARFETYEPNLRATAEREAAEAARQSVNRWHET